MNKTGVLLVGNFFVSARGGRAVGEDLALRLSGSGWRVLTTSWRASRVLRLLDMVATCWRRRGQFEVACVDVFSGAAFVWAEAACLTLRLAGKPYVLALRGGNLPAFAKRHRRRVRSLLRSAACVVAPSSYLRDAMSSYRDDVLLQPNAIDVGAYPYQVAMSFVRISSGAAHFTASITPRWPSPCWTASSGHIPMRASA